MLKGILRLSWIEAKVFLREPLGVIGSLGVPIVLVALLLGAVLNRELLRARTPRPEPPVR